VVLCADICNTSKTFDLKKESRIKYINLLEVFGIDPSGAQKRMNEITELARLATEMGIPYYIVPHAVYSISLPLFRLIKSHTGSNKVTSIHFMESVGEVTFLENHTGPLMDSYKKFLPSVSDLKIAGSHLEAVEKEITPSGNLILIHNIFVERDQIMKLKNRAGLYWCLCPNSNLYIEQRIAPVDIIAGEGCNIVIGTDSLSSNTTLSIIEELKTIQSYFPEFGLETLIGWATINGAKALCEDVFTGSIEPGKKPGLVLLENVDLVNMKLLPGTTVRRLI
jgi:cytosine/adenosine deaminase-related metal-dependent hydrolase